MSVLLEYLFNTRPDQFALFGTLFLISATMSIIIAVKATFFTDRLPKLYRKTAGKARSLALWYGFISLIFYFLRAQQIPYFSMRAWLWVWCLSFAALTTFILYKEVKKIPARKEKIAERLKQQRYFET